MRGAVARGSTILLATLLSLTGCAPPTWQPAARIALAPATETVTLRLGPSRGLAAAARSWRTPDVFQFDVALEVHDPLTDTFVAPPVPLVATLPQKPSPTSRASFAGLAAGGRYRASVVARGNAGGTAPDLVLNASRPTTVTFDLADPAAPRHHDVSVALDPVTFAAEVALPSRATDPAGVPAWVTGFAARLTDPARSATPVATASWAPDRTAAFTNVRGDVAYDLELDVRSTAGTATMRLPGFTIPRADGADQAVMAPFGALTPPTGTLLASYAMSGGAFGVAIDKLDRVWVTNQNGDTVTVRDFAGAAAITPSLAVAGQPRAIAIDPDTDDVWVAALFGGRVHRFVAGAAAADHATGAFPSGVAVDSQHRVWVASLLGGTVLCLAADGTTLGTFTVGASPAAVVVDRSNDAVWVANVDGSSVSRIADGVVATYGLPVGVRPGGIAVAADHTLWVVGNSDGKVHRVAPDGSTVGVPFAAGAGATAIAIDAASGAAWIGLPNGQRIGKWNPDGTRVGTYPSGAFPNAIAIDRRGHVWVAGGGMLAEHAP